MFRQYHTGTCMAPYTVYHTRHHTRTIHGTIHGTIHEPYTAPYTNHTRYNTWYHTRYHTPYHTGIMRGNASAERMKARSLFMCTRDSLSPAPPLPPSPSFASSLVRSHSSVRALFRSLGLGACLIILCPRILERRGGCAYNPSGSRRRRSGRRRRRDKGRSDNFPSNQRNHQGAVGAGASPLSTCKKRASV